MRSLGLCVGASSVDAVAIEAENGSIDILDTHTEIHEGNPKEAVKRYLADINIGQFEQIAMTGRKFKDFVELSTITEPEAVEIAARFLRNGDEIDAIVSAGGETFLLYRLNARGEISSVHSGSKCASGTGEFFLQQIKRMNLSIEQAIAHAESAKPYKVSGRCSVFCKSDCTHALNRGAPIGTICAGLCDMMSEKVLELLANRDIKRIMLVGGTSRNQVMVANLREKLEAVIVPDEAPYFEALGAALWGLRNETRSLETLDGLYKSQVSSFTFLAPLSEARGLVEFKEMKTGEAVDGDVCIAGLDVGSTTTKAIILRMEDNAILGSVYLRTDGDPVAASRRCYADLAAQIGAHIKIIGLGVTGSGRQIAGLHALTLGIINEIIAHAAASVYFGEEVDTIFEIGGQDAKYTYITNGVPSDYAMNEACSAGTGSFLEEAARESFDTGYRDIEGLALQAANPPNFNDQCAAFINSDIKTALQEGIGREDIMGGLVYSICANYLNKVKGARPFGKKIFMQGGVCYNKAVPVAMASLLKRKIVVPPMPGLMGAFGVALEIKNRLELDLMKEQEFDLADLASRKVEYIRTFTCRGGRERCDRKCEIRTVQINGERHPFGGSCNRYYNLRSKKTYETEKLNLVKLRQRLVFEKYSSLVPNGEGKTIGINRSFLINTYYPLFYNFFTKLGLRVILSEEVKPEGINKKGSSFCYPCDISHGLFADLIDRHPDYIFLPQILEIEEKDSHTANNCVFVQGEPYFLKEAFHSGIRLFTPQLWFREGIQKERPVFTDIAKQLGYGKRQAIDAFEFAYEMQREFENECKSIGQRFLGDINSDETCIVLFGRSYNAFADEANMFIPHKFASRGVRIIPYDFLPFEEEIVEPSMYWGQGRTILKCAKFVEKHPNLFGGFVTNFSCGPDSFLITYFREIMGKKPSLTLELDNHTADAGINTRIEAFLDIIDRYRELEKKKSTAYKSSDDYRPATTELDGSEVTVVSSDSRRYKLTDSNVNVLIPSMGELNIQALSAVLQRVGIRAKPLPVPDFESLKLGRKNSSCKECLPLQLTMGSLLNYLEIGERNEEVTVFFMPSASGGCRLGQYHVYMSNLIKSQKIKNVAVLTLNSANGYSEISAIFKVMDIFWQSFTFADLMEEARSALRVLAVDPERALRVHETQWVRFLHQIADPSGGKIDAVVKSIAEELKTIPLKKPISQAKYVALVGEIYVRQDHFCQREIMQKLESQGFIVKIAPLSEWLSYMRYVYKLRPRGLHFKLSKRIRFDLITSVMDRLERRLKKIFETSGLYQFEMIDVFATVRHAEHLISKHVYGEAVLTVGLALREILHSACGVISIGPFGCMPCRLSEALLANRMSVEGLRDIKPIDNYIQQNASDLPFLAIETDGNPLPQLVHAKLEAFCIQADKIHRTMKGGGEGLGAVKSGAVTTPSFH
jgi:predicted CoA-substrate-specific enzyme activase